MEYPNFSGISFTYLFKDIDQLGFDFAIAAIFIAMTAPMIKTKTLLFAVMTSAIMALLLSYLHIQQSLLIATILGMVIGSILDNNAKIKGDNL